MFSILVANYNNGKYFRDCYDSIINQTYQDFEVIIVDDASTDNSVEIIKNIIGNDERFKIFQNDKNYGCGYTKRRCAELANGEIFGFLDPDDTLRNDALEIMVNAHEENESIGLIYSNILVCDESLNEIRIHKTKQVVGFNDDYYNFKGEISHFAAFKIKVYNLTSGIDPYFKRAFDKDLYMKLCEVAPVKHIDEELYKYRIHNGGISTSTNSTKAYFWHWVALIKMAERRNLNLEDLFLEKFITRQQLEYELDRNNSIKEILKTILKKVGRRLRIIKFK